MSRRVGPGAGPRSHSGPHVGPDGQAVGRTALGLRPWPFAGSSPPGSACPSPRAAAPSPWPISTEKGMKQVARSGFAVGCANVGEASATSAPFRTERRGDTGARHAAPLVARHRLDACDLPVRVERTGGGLDDGRVQLVGDGEATGAGGERQRPFHHRLAHLTHRPAPVRRGSVAPRWPQPRKGAPPDTPASASAAYAAARQAAWPITRRGVWTRPAAAEPTHTKPRTTGRGRGAVRAGGYCPSSQPSNIRAATNRLTRPQKREERQRVARALRTPRQSVPSEGSCPPYAANVTKSRRLN